MVRFRHRSGRTVTAEPGTTRYEIFARSKNWSVVARPATRPAAAASPAPANPGGSEALELKTVPELHDIADDLGLTGYKSINKAGLLQRIAEAQAEG